MNIKQHIKDFIPPIFFKAKKYLFHKNDEHKSLYQDLTSANRLFKDKHCGQRVFILASGPSIQTQNLKFLQDELCIAVSHFHLHDDIQIIQPKYHILAPPHLPFGFNDCSKFFVDFKKAYSNSEVSIFLGLTPYECNYVELLKKYPELTLPNLYYIDYSYSQQLDESNYLNQDNWNITKKPFAMRTVIYGAIQLAHYMGCSEIYLLGCDHDYLNDISRTANHHFYKEENGISDKEHLSQFSKERWFFEYYMRWKQYRLMNDYAQKNGFKIMNATNGGMLDVFERVVFNDLFLKKPKVQ